ncbi:MAG: hypothetical protein V1784_03605, partial [bacterium]
MRYAAFLWLVGLGCIALSSAGHAEQIDLVYPPRSQDASPYVFADTVRAAFLFGNISPALAKLEINAHEIEVTSDGAFLAYVPLDTFAGTKSLRIALIEDGQQTEVIDFPYVFSGETEVSTEEEAERSAYAFPMVLQVTAENAATRTMPDGTYEFFPPLGTKLVAAGIKEKSFVVYLGAGAVTYISERFVSADSGSILEPA